MTVVQFAFKPYSSFTFKKQGSGHCVELTCIFPNSHSEKCFHFHSFY